VGDPSFCPLKSTPFIPPRSLSIYTPLPLLIHSQPAFSSSLLIFSLPTQNTFLFSCQAFYLNSSLLSASLMACLEVCKEVSWKLLAVLFDLFIYLFWYAAPPPPPFFFPLYVRRDDFNLYKSFSPLFFPFLGCLKPNCEPWNTDIIIDVVRLWLYFLITSIGFSFWSWRWIY
jgi:hypothetical protein